MENIYWFDIFIFAMTLILGFRGIINGLVREFFGILGIIGGVFIAAHYSQQAAFFIQKYIAQIQNTDLALFIGFLAVLIVFWTFCLLVGSIIRRLVRLSGLSFLDRVGGFVFGSAKIFLIFAILVFCISKIDFLNQKLQQYTQGSYSLALLEQIGAFIMNDPYIKAGIETLSTGFDKNTTE